MLRRMFAKHRLDGVSPRELENDLVLAARLYADAATTRGSGELFEVWLAIQRARGLSDESAFATLGPLGLRGLARSSFERGDDTLGIASYRAYLAIHTMQSLQDNLVARSRDQRATVRACLRDVRSRPRGADLARVAFAGEIG